MTAKRGIFVAPFDELVDPNTLAELAASAEAHGWDGFFVWDHVRYRAPVRAVADPWVALAAVATATDRIRLGPLVTPLARRRVHKLARETVTLDDLRRKRIVRFLPFTGESKGSAPSAEHLAMDVRLSGPLERAMARIPEEEIERLKSRISLERLAEAGVRVNRPGHGRRTLRFVTHFGINATDIEDALERAARVAGSSAVETGAPALVGR